MGITLNVRTSLFTRNYDTTTHKLSFDVLTLFRSQKANITL